MKSLMAVAMFLAVNVLFGEPVLTLESEATGEKLGPYRLRHGGKIVIRREQYKVLLDKPRTTEKKLDRIIFPELLSPSALAATGGGRSPCAELRPPTRRL